MEFYSSLGNAKKAGFDAQAPKDVFTEFSEGESVTLTEHDYVHAYIEGAEGLRLRAPQGTPEEKARVNVVFKTNVSREEEVDGHKVIRKVIEVRHLFQVFTHYVVDVEATKERDLLKRESGLSDVAIAQLPAVLKGVTLERNNWQLWWLYVWNDVNAELKEFAAKKESYPSGNSMGDRTARILAAVGERKCVFTKDKNVDSKGEARYYMAMWKPKGVVTYYPKSRSYWVVEGLTDEDVQKLVNKAKELKISTIGAASLEASKSAE